MHWINRLIKIWSREWWTLPNGRARVWRTKCNRYACDPFEMLDEINGREETLLIIKILFESFLLTSIDYALNLISTQIYIWFYIEMQFLEFSLQALGIFHGAVARHITSIEKFSVVENDGFAAIRIGEIVRICIAIDWCCRIICCRLGRWQGTICKKELGEYEQRVIN